MQEKSEKVRIEKIKSIIAYIDNIIESQFKDLPHLNESDANVATHLVYIKSLLTQGTSFDSDDVNIAKIYETIHYIENIRMKPRLNFFNDTKGNSLAERMKKNKEVILPLHERVLGSSKPFQNTFIPAKSEPIFGSIHGTLVDLISNRYQFVKDEEARQEVKKTTVAWNYPYPVDENGEVMNNAIGEWQAMIIPFKEGSQKAFNDFQRDLSIRGITAKTNKEADDLLNYLLEGCDYPGQKNAVKNWLQANGGQNLNRFLDMLMASPTFTDNPASLLSTRKITAGWTIEKGKAVFSYDTMVYSFNEKGQAVINDGMNHLTTTSSPEEIKKPGMPYSVLPLMRVQAKITLNVEGDVVTPTITALNVSSTCADIKMPNAEMLQKPDSLGYN